MESRNSKISSIIKYYKEYYKILSQATRSKCLECEKKKLKSSNKIKTTWEIIHTESGRNIKKCGIQSLNVEGKNTENQQIIAEVFSKYSIKVAKIFIKTLMLIILYIMIMVQMTNYFMNNAFKSPHPIMNYKHTTTEIVK